MFEELIARAKEVQGEFPLSEYMLSAGTVAAALRTRNGNIYTGICIDLYCGIGFCAEHSAVADMLKHRETKIEAIVAVDREGILAPCGRCREMMYQVDKTNLETKILIAPEKVVCLKDLLPYNWL